MYRELAERPSYSPDEQPLDLLLHHVLLVNLPSYGTARSDRFTDHKVKDRI